MNRELKPNTCTSAPLLPSDCCGHVPVMMSFSGGRSSALAMRLLTFNGVPENMVILFANTGKEKNETLDFVHECEVRWNLPIVWIEGVYNDYDLSKETMLSSVGFRVVNYETAKRWNEKNTPFEKMIDWINCGIVPNRMSRFCTRYLKLVPMQRYMESIGINDYDQVMGIRYDEPERVVKNKDKIMPLVAAKITQPQVREWWAKQPFDLQLKDYEGNCDLCHLKSRRKRLTILNEHPEIAEWWSRQESKTDSEFEQGMPVEKLLALSKGRFSKVQDGYVKRLTEPELFSDVEISCFCGD